MTEDTCLRCKQIRKVHAAGLGGCFEFLSPPGGLIRVRRATSKVGVAIVGTGLFTLLLVLVALFVPAAIPIAAVPFFIFIVALPIYVVLRLYDIVEIRRIIEEATKPRNVTAENQES